MEANVTHLLYGHFILQIPSTATAQIAMYQADVQPVLRCEQCNKPFDKGECGLRRMSHPKIESVADDPLG